MKIVQKNFRHCKWAKTLLKLRVYKILKTLQVCKNTVDTISVQKHCRHYKCTKKTH